MMHLFKDNPLLDKQAIKDTKVLRKIVNQNYDDDEISALDALRLETRHIYKNGAGIERAIVEVAYPVGCVCNDTTIHGAMRKAGDGSWVDERHFHTLYDTQSEGKCVITYKDKNGFGQCSPAEWSRWGGVFVGLVPDTTPKKIAPEAEAQLMAAQAHIAAGKAPLENKIEVEEVDAKEINPEGVTEASQVHIKDAIKAPKK